MKELFSKHIHILQRDTEEQLSAMNIDGLIIASGEVKYHFMDDYGPAHKANPHFRHWCPLTGDNHFLIIRPGSRPTLLAYCPDDFWHLVTSIDTNDFWVDLFEIKIFNSIEKIWDFLETDTKEFNFCGETRFNYLSKGLKQMPTELFSRLNWQRSFKTEYEIHCLRQANKLAAPGHIAAKNAFLSGATELEIYYEYVRTLKIVEENLPYTAIIGLNTNAAILHYHGRDNGTRNANSLLIDAGASFNGYASDISRTYTSNNAHDTFKNILASMNSSQIELCSLVKPGFSNEELHLTSHQKIAQILVDHNIILNLNSDDVVETGLSKTFYPHGVGHLLGIQVHDVGGHQRDLKGAVIPRSKMYPLLRSGRILQEKNCLTVEPGLYFIDLLLTECRNGQFSKDINWKLIEELKSCGGIRIEDDILVTKNGNQNLTREFLD